MFWSRYMYIMFHTSMMCWFTLQECGSMTLGCFHRSVIFLTSSMPMWCVSSLCDVFHASVMYFMPLWCISCLWDVFHASGMCFMPLWCVSCLCDVLCFWDVFHAPGKCHTGMVVPQGLFTPGFTPPWCVFTLCINLLQYQMSRLSYSLQTNTWNI